MMGQTVSEPVQHDPGLGYVGLVLRAGNKIRLIHAPEEVINTTQQVIHEINAKARNGIGVFTKDLNGTTAMYLGPDCFDSTTGKVAATSGKMFAIRMLEEMMRLGYDLVTSTDLSRDWNRATWIFEKKVSGRRGRKVTCLALGRGDTFILLRASDHFIDIVRNSVKQCWPYGVKDQAVLESCGETVTEIKLSGSPWNCSEDQEHVFSRTMLIRIIANLGSAHYRLLAGTNIKGGADSLLFIQDENYKPSISDFCCIGLNKKNQLRLFNCGAVISGKVRDTIERNNGEIESMSEMAGCVEIKLRGKPWSCIGEKGVHSRQLISRISGTMLGCGWCLVGGITISRSSSDKGILLYSRDQVSAGAVACLAMTGAHTITLIDFPPSTRDSLRSVVSGISREQEIGNNCYQIELTGSAWSSSEPVSLHARSTLMHLLKTANSLGWELAASTDVSSKYYPDDNGPDYPEDVHSWYFIRKNSDSVSKHPSGTSLTVDLPPSYEEVMKNNI